MISLLNLNKFFIFVVFFIFLIFNSTFAENEPSDIWGSDESINQDNNSTTNKNKTIIKIVFDLIALLYIK